MGFACLKCCTRCLENLIEYLNKTAYAYMAVSGDSYCTSAWNGFLLHLKHIEKFGSANALAYMFIFMGKLFVTSLTCSTFYFLARSDKKAMESIDSISGPMVMIGVAAFITAHIFLCLFDEATMATLHCLAIDMDLHQGKPQFGPPTFH